LVDPDLIRSAVLTVEPTEPGGDGRCWPSPLRAGDVVSVVAPSGPYDRDRVRQGVDILRSWGLDAHYGDRPAGPDHRLSYISADDQSRADDFVAAWCSPDTSAVWAARGGYGAQRMIDLIDFDALRAAGPKLLIGFSDITALHVRIGRELNMITIHGPVVGSVAQLSDPPSVTALQKLIMALPAEPGMVLASGHVVVAGTATGRLWGGNLSLLASDVGIEPPPDEPGVLVVEDIREDSYRIDRMLTQLARAGWLDQVVGVGIGQFEGNPTSELLEHVVADRLAGLGVPVVAGLDVGHGERNLALPLGAQVRISG
jgi:muramoyltetrapeptide carboxypeptidase